MRGFIKAAGSRTVVTGATGCMYVANTSYMTTPWIVPWMHTQLGAGGSSAVGMAAGLRALKRKGKIKDEKINVINFSGDLGAGDMGIGGISAALQSDYDLLIIMYDNESAANTDIQATGSTTYGAQTTFTPPGTKHPIMQRRWKKNVAGMLAVGHPTCRYVATACATYPPTDYLNKVRKALAIGGPTFIHTYDPCPKGLGLSSALLATSLASWESNAASIRSTKSSKATSFTPTTRARRGKGRIPVKEFLTKQGRFDHLIAEHFAHIQKMVDQMWEEWEIPGVAPFKGY